MIVKYALSVLYNTGLTDLQLTVTVKMSKNDVNDANDEDRIVKQFGKSNVNANAKTSSTDNTEPLQFFNITDKIIDKIREDKYLIKIGFRELMAYATPIVFNRDLDNEKIDELYASIVDGYEIPFTIDAIYDPNTNIQEKSIKVINGNHRHGAVCKYITEHDKLFSCNYKVYVWIYVVEDCESTNVSKSISLYTKVNSHLPFKEPIIVDINVMAFLDKLCKQKRFKGLILKKDQCEKARQPRINKKELFNLLNTSREILESFVSMHSVNKNNLIITDDILSQFIENINEINHRISLKGINNIYGENLIAQNKGYYEQAVELGFFLNLKKSNYAKEIWIKYICNPRDI
jgi:hypothetical protein